MLWLEDKGIVTCNAITSNDLNKITELEKKYCAKDKYDLKDADAYIGEEQSDFFTSKEYIEYKWVGHNGNGGLGNIYIKKEYINPRFHALTFLFMAEKTNYEQKKYNIALKNLITNGDNTDINNNINIINSLYNNISSEIFEYFLKNNFVDFHFFVRYVLPIVTLEQIEKYDINKDYEYKKYIENYRSFSNFGSRDALENLDVATKNGKVLKLAKSINLK